MKPFPAIRTGSIILPLLLASCSAPYVGGREASQDELAARGEIIRYAQGLIGTRDLKPLGHGFKNDCSGFVHGVYRGSGRRIEYGHLRKGRSLSESLYRTLLGRDLTFTQGRPHPGDAAFFWNTVERSGEGISHVALVERVDQDGTVTLIHYGSGKVDRVRMNLRHSRERTDGSGKVINDYIRRGTSGSPRRDYLAGNLFAAYGDLYRHTGR